MPDLLFARLATLDRDVTPERCKLHLATRNREGNEPLALYRKDEFDEWQSYQSAEKRPFTTRKFVVALIDMRLPRQQPQRWLFAGVQEVVGGEVREVERSVRERWGWSPGTAVHYQMQPRSACDDLKGLIVRFTRPWRYAYPRAESLAPMLEIHGEDQH